MNSVAMDSGQEVNDNHKDRALVRLTVVLIWTCTATAAIGDDLSPAQQLVEAARQGKIERVKELLDDGVDVNARGKFDITAVWQAASRGHLELLRFLVEEKQADVNLPDSVWHATPLMFAQDPEIVELLVKHGARGVQGSLNSAAQQGNAKLVGAIIRSRQMSPEGLAQARAHARIGEHDEIVKLLDEQSSQPLPDLPVVADETLSRYAGPYVDERLNEVDVLVRDGSLIIKSSDGRERKLVAIDDQTFVIGATRCRFRVENDKVVEFLREDLFSARRFVPRVEVFDAPSLDSDALAERDDPRVLATARWPAFRGIEARGLAVDQNLPDQWNVEEGINVRWKTPIPGLSHSCPIVWDGRVYLTTAVSEAEKNDLRIGLYGSIEAVDDDSKHSWIVLCLDLAAGEVIWQQVAEEGVPTVKRHLKSTQANSTPATDGKHVVALFNTGGLYCYDIEGRLIWSKQLGVLDSGAFHDRDFQWGFASSPIIYRDTVIVQCDLQENSFIATYDIRTGEEIWKQSRDEVPSWATPTVHESPTGPLLITNATNFARAYDVLSGRERWRLAGNAALTIPTPFVAHDLVFVTSGYRPIQPIFVARLDARGDISLQEDEESNAGIAWSKSRGGPYLPTPIAYQGYFFTCGNNGIVTCYEARTGKQMYRKRASRGSASSFTASPVAADGRLYLTAESGEVLVLRAGPSFEVLQQNPLGEYCLATPAICGGLFLARTHKHLIAIGRPLETNSESDKH